MNVKEVTLLINVKEVERGDVVDLSTNLFIKIVFRSIRRVKSDRLFLRHSHTGRLLFPCSNHPEQSAPFLLDGEFNLQVHHEPQARTLHGVSGILGIFVVGCLIF